MRMTMMFIVAALTIACPALAQSTGQGRGEQRGDACPPDVRGSPPTVGEGPGSAPLSDKLAQSKGVICPPSGGRLRVIPPPGAPGGDPNVQPK